MENHIFEYKGNTPSNGYLFIVMLFFWGVTMMMMNGGGVCDIFLYPARMFNPFFVNLYSLCWTHPPQGGAVLNGAQKTVNCSYHDGTWKQNPQNRSVVYIYIYTSPQSLT